MEVLHKSVNLLRWRGKFQWPVESEFGNGCISQQPLTMEYSAGGKRGYPCWGTGRRAAPGAESVTAQRETVLQERGMNSVLIRWDGGRESLQHIQDNKFTSCGKQVPVKKQRERERLCSRLDNAKWETLKAVDLGMLRMIKIYLTLLIYSVILHQSSITLHRENRAKVEFGNI